MNIKPFQIRVLLVALVMIFGGLAIGEMYKTHKQQEVLHEWWDRMTTAEQAVNVLQERLKADDEAFSAKLEAIQQQQARMQVTLDKLSKYADEHH